MASARGSLVVVAGAAVIAAAAVVTTNYQVGDVQRGAAELCPGARYNVDTYWVGDHFDLGLDVLTVIVETPAAACVDAGTMALLDRHGPRPGPAFPGSGAGGGLLDAPCTVLPVYVFTTDTRATTIDGVVAAVKAFLAAPENQLPRGADPARGRQCPA